MIKRRKETSDREARRDRQRCRSTVRCDVERSEIELASVRCEHARVISHSIALISARARARRDREGKIVASAGEIFARGTRWYRGGSGRPGNLMDIGRGRG